MGLFQGDPISRHDGLVEREPRFRAIPFDEFTDGVIVGALGTQGRKAVQNRRFRLLKVRQFQNSFRSALGFFFWHVRSLSDGRRLAPGSLLHPKASAFIVPDLRGTDGRQPTVTRVLFGRGSGHTSGSAFFIPYPRHTI